MTLPNFETLKCIVKLSLTYPGFAHRDLGPVLVSMDHDGVDVHWTAVDATRGLNLGTCRPPTTVMELRSTSHHIGVAPRTKFSMLVC